MPLVERPNLEMPILNRMESVHRLDRKLSVIELNLLLQAAQPVTGIHASSDHEGMISACVYPVSACARLPQGSFFKAVADLNKLNKIAFDFQSTNAKIHISLRNHITICITMRGAEVECDNIDRESEKMSCHVPSLSTPNISCSVLRASLDLDHLFLRRYIVILQTNENENPFSSKKSFAIVA
ncbi:hypothetical protein EKO04_002020 [Ascochyta lentis]|uniref:Uncharacterized protein n=1 Tax=Ascochyta lentis TaxID=205686 RepID=A0A8H7MM77_9PLEO|nr:hypothetical protein EKO04_002020 [Ascochyta lentis]